MAPPPSARLRLPVPLRCVPALRLALTSGAGREGGSVERRKGGSAGGRPAALALRAFPSTSFLSPPAARCAGTRRPESEAQIQGLAGGARDAGEAREAGNRAGVTAVASRQ